MKALVTAVLSAVLIAVSTGSGSAAPASPEPGVTVWDASGPKAERCSKLVQDGRKGCRAFIRSKGRVRFTVRTLAGDMEFGRCLYNYDLQIDGAGRTLVDGLISAGDNPCNDVRPCVNREHTDWLPWHGRIVRQPNGTLVHRVDACVDSCLGQFRGELVMRLAQVGDRWRATALRAPVGASGWVISGASWDLAIPGLDIRDGRGRPFSRAGS